MSEAFTITLTGAGKATDRLMKFGNSPGLSREIGVAVRDEVKEHLFRLDGERANSLGGKRSHFYWEAGKNTEYNPLPDGAEVVITKTGLRKRWLGGEIHAVNGKYLTIPARSESYGVPARQFPRTLRFIQFRSGAAALVIDDRTESTSSVDYAGNVTTKRGGRNKRLKTAGVVEYWLVPSVYQRPDPSVLPSPEKLLNAAVGAAEDYLSGFNT